MHYHRQKGEHIMSPESEYKLLGTASEQEKELINILIDSSLYRGMYPDEKKKLLNYLVTSYFYNIESTDGPLPR
jgi:hypothetical protein